MEGNLVSKSSISPGAQSQWKPTPSTSSDLGDNKHINSQSKILPLEFYFLNWQNVLFHKISAIISIFASWSEWGSLETL